MRVQLSHGSQAHAGKHCPDHNLSGDQELPDSKLSGAIFSRLVPFTAPPGPLQHGKNAQP